MRCVHSSGGKINITTKNEHDKITTTTQQPEVVISVKNVSKKFLKRMKGENANVDISKLSGELQGYYRIRKGKLRIIFEVIKGAKVLYIEKIDFRGDVYK